MRTLLPWLSLTGCAMGGAMHQATLVGQCAADDVACSRRHPQAPIAIGTHFYPEAATELAGTTTPNRTRNHFATPAAVAMITALAACHPMLAAESSSPPGRSARLDAVNGFWGVKSYRLELSQGVALAVSCTYGGPCEKLVATSDDTAIAEVRAASLQALRPAGYTGNQQPAAAIVLVGKAPGTTTVRLRSKDGGRDIRVTVIPPPAPPAMPPTTTAVAREVRRS